MYWIRKPNFKEKKGYLYLRETIYVRDKRTFKKIPKKYGDGLATKNRSKYSKKKDTYCGKIYEITLKHVITFSSYIKEKGEDYLSYKIDVSFDKLLDDFIEYLLYIHEIDKKEFYNGKKKVYSIGEGFLCLETIEWLRRFNIKKNSQSKKEIERFANRCQDIGIYDEEVISIFYTKFIPEIIILEKEENIMPEKQQFKDMKEFIKKQYD